MGRGPGILLACPPRASPKPSLPRPGSQVGTPPANVLTQAGVSRVGAAGPPFQPQLGAALAFAVRTGCSTVLALGCWLGQPPPQEHGGPAKVLGRPGPYGEAQAGEPCGQHPKLQGQPAPGGRWVAPFLGPYRLRAEWG